MEGEKELLQLQNRFRELAGRSYQQNMFTFTGFLGLCEQDIFFRMEKEFRYAGFALSGGREQADRKVLRFGDAVAFGYEAPFPIVCIHIRPLQQKFADRLSHRDFLGALMNLGIDRSTLGDILTGEGEAYLFCLESVAAYICENLEQVKHTHVSCRVAEETQELREEEPQVQRVQVSSLRADALIARVYHKSRGDCLELFRAGRVFVDGRLCENNARQLKGGETVNVRGYGKFILSSNTSETRKGKLNAEVSVFG